MFTVHLEPGTRFKLNTTVYLISKRLPGLAIEALDERFAEKNIFTHNEIIKYLSEGILKFECKGKNVKVNSTSDISTEYDFNDIENLKDKERAIFRREVIRPIIEMDRSFRNHQVIQDRVKEINSWIEYPKLISEKFKGIEIHKVSMSSIYRWISLYETSSGDFRSLLPGYYKCGGKNKERINYQVLEYINDSINDVYLTKQRVTIGMLRSAVLNKIAEYNLYSLKKLRCPPLSTFGRIVSAIPEFELIAKRVGKRIAANKFKPVYGGVITSYPLERVEIDHTPIDVILVDENGNPIGRPHLILAIDKHTKHILGFSIGIGNSVGWSEVMDCIKHILTDKSYVQEMYPYIENKWNAFGVPQCIVLDNGPEFKNNAMDDAAFQIGFELDYCPPRVPEWKGSIERFFRTANMGMFHTFPGTTRSNPQMLGDENPEELACLPFSVFLALVHIWIVDVYSQRINAGAKGIPSKLWDAAMETHPSFPNSISEVAILFGKVEYRKINRSGIVIDGRHYNSQEINNLLLKFTKSNNGLHEDFKVKYDPKNIGEIQVYDHLFEKQWIRVPSTNPKLTHNLSEWEYKEAKALAKSKFGEEDEEAIARALMLMRRMMENCVGYSPKQIAKANNVNSDNEISHFVKSQSTYSSNATLTDACPTEPSMNSDFGHSISDFPMKTEEEIPDTCIPKPDNKVVDIRSKKKVDNNSNSSTLAKKSAIENSIKYDDTFFDFTDFGVSASEENENNDK